MDLLELYDKLLIEPIKVELKEIKHNKYILNETKEKYINELNNLLLSIYKDYYKRNNKE